LNTPAHPPHKAETTYLGDLKGGISAALLALPVELVYGLFAVAPLGVAYAEHGMRAALWGCILGGVLAFLFRGTGGMLTGTRPATGLILAALATELLTHPRITAVADPAAYVFALLLLCTALAGLFQFLFGLARVGRALKYIPYPVIAGLMLGVGILMVLGSLRPALGVDDTTGWGDLLSASHPASIAITLAGLALCYFAPRWKIPVPGSILAIVVCTLMHQGFVYSFGAEQLGGTLANLSATLPSTVISAGGLAWHEVLGWLPQLSAYALTIAALSSIETMLCLSAIGNVHPHRPNANREFCVLGLANLVTGISGATASLGNLPRVNANLAAGGRSTVSNLVYAATLAGIVILVGGHLALVPQAVTAAIVIYYAFLMVDDGTRRIVQQVVKQRSHFGQQHYRMLLANLSVILLVALVAVVGDMMKAVGIGIVAAMFLFVRTRMKPVIRRVSHGDWRRSLKIRTKADDDLLNREGRAICLIEADGPLFFGTADNIAIEIERVSAESRLIVLDFKQVRDIDPTGARTLLLACRRQRAQGRELLICGIAPHLDSFLKAMDLESAIPPGHWHQNIDQALEDAEDRLLAHLGGHTRHERLALAETALAAGMSPSDIAVLESVLIRSDHPCATELFHIGDAGNSLFLTSDGSVDILIPLKGGKRKRVVSLAPGVLFGEVAILEGKPRSATAFLTGPSLVWELTREGLDKLRTSHPAIAHQILLNIGRQMAVRLRSVTHELAVLEDGG